MKEVQIVAAQEAHFWSRTIIENFRFNYLSIMYSNYPLKAKFGEESGKQLKKFFSDYEQ